MDGWIWPRAHARPVRVLIIYTHTSYIRSTQQIPTQINLTSSIIGGGGSWRQINFSLFHPQSAADAAREIARTHSHSLESDSLRQFFCKNKLIQIVSLLLSDQSNQKRFYCQIRTLDAFRLKYNCE